MHYVQAVEPIETKDVEVHDYEEATNDFVKLELVEMHHLVVQVYWLNLNNVRVNCMEIDQIDNSKHVFDKVVVNFRDR